MERDNQIITTDKKGTAFKNIFQALPALVVLMVIAGGAFVGSSLVQRPVYRDGFAACYSCGGGTCPDGWSYGSDSCSYQSCDARRAEACSGHQSGGSGSGGSGSGGGNDTGSYSQSACSNACNSIKGTTNGGRVSGRRNNSKNEGGVENCECYCSVGRWTNGSSVCDGGQSSNECNNGSTAVRDGCNYTCTNGAWIETSCEGSSGSGGTGTGGSGGGTSGGSCGANGDVACDGESRVSSLNACGDGRGRVCQIDGAWSGCVNADKCGFQGVKGPGEACNFSSACSTLCCVKSDGSLASGQAGTCQDSASNPACTYGGSNPGGQCSFNGNSYTIPSSGSGNFVGCGNEVSGGDGDQCNNCYVQSGSTNGGSCSISCFRETLSCGLRCRESSQDEGQGGTQESSQQDDSTTNSTDEDDTDDTSFTQRTFYCHELTPTVNSPKIGDTVAFTCSAAGSGLPQVSRFEFQYRVNSGQFRNIGISSIQRNVSIGLSITEVGTYEVQCRACSSSRCTEWDTL